jgi:predicted phage-related endonuclease
MSATRHDGIGGTDISAVMDLYRDPGLPRLNPFKTPLQVYERILNGVPDTAKISKRAHIGTLVEPHIFKEFCERNKLARRTFRRNVETHDPAHPFMRGEADAKSDQYDMIVDCKLVGRSGEALYGDEGTDEIPDYYRLQLEWYAMLFNVGRLVLAVWFDSRMEGEHYAEYHATRDNELRETMRYVAAKFWRDHVEPRKPPPVTSADDSGALKRLYPKDTEVLRMATPEEIELISACREASAAHKEVGARLETLKAQLQAAIGFHEGLSFGADKVTWKAQKGRLNAFKALDQIKQLAASGSLDLAAIEQAIKDNTPETQRVLRLGKE